MSENLWPTDFGAVEKKTPVAILREQATALGERTANIVVGRVQSEGIPGPVSNFRHELYVYSPPLGYSLPLLAIMHDIDLYPAQISMRGDPDQLVAADPTQLASHLKEVFSREKTKKTIASLLAQSTE